VRRSAWKIREADQFDPLLAHGTANGGVAQRIQLDLTLRAIHRDEIVSKSRMTCHFGHALQQTTHHLYEVRGADAIGQRYHERRTGVDVFVRIVP